MTLQKIRSRVRAIQLIVFLFLILLIWVDEYLQLPSRIFGTPPGTPNLPECIFETIEILFVCSLCLFFSQQLLNYIQYLEGFVSICANCKKVRHEGHWIPIESYIADRSETQFTHGICPECARKLYGVDLKGK